MMQTRAAAFLFTKGQKIGRCKTFHCILLLCFAVIIHSCKKDDLIIAPEDQLTRHISSTHFDYYYAEKDRDIIDTSWQEKYYKWLTDTLKLDVKIKLEYHKYRDRAHVKRVTGKDTNGFAEPGTNRFHTIWKVDNHESVHVVITQSIGHPAALFNEGIAVACQADYFKYPNFIPLWNGQDFNLLAKNYKRQGVIPQLSKLLGVYSYWDFDTNITYPVSGSFVAFLINHYGLARTKQLISVSRFEDAEDRTREIFHQTFSKSIEDVWKEWESFIANYPG